MPNEDTTTADLRLLEETKQAIEAQLGALTARATTQEERDRISEAYNKACEQWGAALNAKLLLNDERINAVVDEVAQANRMLAESVRRAESVGTIIDHMATAVAAGTKLLSLIK